jgi:hypothetical protein
VIVHGKPSGSVCPPADALPLLHALARYSDPRGLLCPLGVRRERLPAVCDIVSAFGVAALSKKDSDLWTCAQADLLVQLRAGRLKAWGLTRLTWVEIPTALWGSLAPEDIDWGHGNLFPKFPDQVIHSIQIVPAASPASAVHAGNLDQADGRSKRRRVHDDALLKNKFETVIKNAAQRWPNRQKRPPVSAMVEELIRLGKAQGYDGETLRKILSGTYQPAKRLGISTDW